MSPEPAGAETIEINLCRAHWTILREAIDAAGLGHLVAPDAEAGERQLERMLSGKAQPTDFDPRINAQTGLFNAAIQITGTAGVVAASGCPVCALQAFDWIADVVRVNQGIAGGLGLLLPEIGS